MPYTHNRRYNNQLYTCIDNGYPAFVTEALMTLLHAQTVPNLRVAYAAWMEWDEEDTSAFVDAVTELACGEPFLCEDCEGIAWAYDATWVGENQICNRCIRSYSYCDTCGEYTNGETQALFGNSYCDCCWDEYTTTCNECLERYPTSYNHNHDPIEYGCMCDAPLTHFHFPANGHGVITEDERLTIELPKGVIDDQGLDRIRDYLFSVRRPDTAGYENPWGDCLDWTTVTTIMADLGDEWQTKRGNYTKRLSAAFAKQGMKLPPHTLSDIGNIATDHSTNGATWHIEFTREVNGNPALFCHEGSCWWGGGSYGRSRCALKNWGGMGLRTYYSRDAEQAHGRVWVQPLNTDMEPTHDAINAHAYVVFNAYGELGGYAAARIVAHLTDKTYKKITFTNNIQYINNTTGFLVADQATCSATTAVDWSFDDHDQLDAHDFNYTPEKAIA